MKYIINLGEILIDIIPTASVRLGETCYAPHPGGAIANVAVAIARLGGASRFIGGIAEDEFGRLLMQVLADNHVDTQYVQVIKGTSTAIALVTLQAAGQRRFTFFRQETADSSLEPRHLNNRAWQDACICHVGGVLLAVEPARSATFAAMELTRKVGSIVSFDINVRPTLWESPAEIRTTLAQAVERADILKLSIEEAEFLSDQGNGPNEPLLAGDRLNKVGEALLEKGPRLVIITLGAHGAYLLTAQQRVEVPPLVVRPVDTTGAGDAFMGAILYSLQQQGCSTPSDLNSLKEQDLSALGSFANVVAGLSVTRYGGISSFPFLHEVNSFSAP